jgi:cell division protein FtsN
MARRNHSRRKESAPGWVWMSFGLGLGLLVAIGVYLRAPSAATTPAAAAVQPAAARSAPSNPAPRSETPADAGRDARDRATQGAVAGEGRDARGRATPGAVAGSRFSFYEVLPEFEVVVPDDDKPAAPATRRAQIAEAPGSFLLQAGSFSAAGDADRLQANLALLGFESHVQRVTIDDGVFNRVRIGPIGDLDSAKRTQRRLRDAGIDTLLMKVPN